MNQQVKIQESHDRARVQEAIADYVRPELEALYYMCEDELQPIAAHLDAAREALRKYIPEPGLRRANGSTAS